VVTRPPEELAIGLFRKALRRLSGGRYGHRRSSPRDRLLHAMPRGSVCAEIGVFAGDFSERILHVVRPARLHLVDPWRYETEPEYSSAWYGGTKGGSQADMDAVYASVCRRFAPQVQAGTVAIHRASSVDEAAAFPDAYFDWVYVDGNHRYEFVKADLEGYASKVKPGGLIAGDDYQVVGWWEDGVTRAVDEFIARSRCRVLSTAGNQFILRRPG